MSAPSKTQERKARPPIQVAVRNNVGTQFRTYTGPLKQGTGTLPDTGVAYSTFPTNEDTQLAFNADGSLVVLIEKKKTVVYNTSEAAPTPVFTVPRENVDRAFFSPCSSFLVTYEVIAKDGKQNLFVWSTHTGEEVLKFYQKEVRESQWPTISWTHDEKLMGHLTTNEVKFYDGKEPTQPIERLIHPGVKQFSFAPGGDEPQIAVFKPPQPSKGQPASVSVYKYPNLSDVVASKSFFKVDDCVLKWSPMCNNLLISSSTEMKKGSYYGDSSLHLLSTDPNRPFTGTVPFGGNVGPVQCAEWSPEGRDFMVIQGLQPARATLFLAKDVKPIRDYGQASRNTVKFSPSGRFICIGGFGNLAGQMDFWDKNKFRMIGTCQMSDATTYAWTPDSRNFITAANRPRRRIDERYIVWTYAGEKVYEEKVDRLYQIECQPFPKGVFPNQPMSPRLKNVSLKQLQEKKPQKYIPPSLRAKGGSKIMDRQLAGPSKYVARGPASVSRSTPAAAAANDKNAKRRERRARQRANKAKAKAAGGHF